MKKQKYKQTIGNFLAELIFNKWSLLFILYAISALIIGHYGVLTAKTVNWIPADLNINQEAKRRNLT